MARQILFYGPDAPEGGLLCTACVMLWKGDATQSETVQRANAMAATSDGKPVLIDVGGKGIEHEISRPMDAVAFGLFPPFTPPQMGLGGNGMCPFPVPLCWSHIMGLSLKNGVLPASPAEAAAFGGAALIGGNRG